MRKRSKKTVEASFTKRIAAVIMTASYISVISPITLLAETAINNADIKGTVSVKEEKSEVLISAEEGGTVVLGEASIEIPEGALKKDTRIASRAFIRWRTQENPSATRLRTQSATGSCPPERSLKRT